MTTSVKDVYRNYTWRKGEGKKYELYKSVSSLPLEKLGRSESSTLVLKKREPLPESWSHNCLEYRLAIGKI